ncbi:MAG: hypothetical protein ACQEQ8_05265 [Pseudomonadota bacterium]
MPAELLVVLLNLIIILVSYVHLYPKVAGNNINKIAFFDLFATGLALFIVGFKYWGTGYPFLLMSFSVNWFWYTFITYLILEIPVVLWYCKKHDIKFK